MDEKERRKIKKEYKTEKRQEQLNNLLCVEYGFIQDYAKLELGIKLPPITKEFIDSPENELELESSIHNKIIELAKKSNPKINSTLDPKITEIINGFSIFKKAIFHTYLFDCSLGTGNIDKEFLYDNAFEKNLIDQKITRLKEYYDLLGCPEMLSLIEKAQDMRDYKALNQLWKLFDLKKHAQCKIRFIRDHWKEFIFS